VLLRPMVRLEVIAGGGGAGLGGAGAVDVFLASFLLRFLLRLPVDGWMCAVRWRPMGEMRLCRLSVYVAC